MTKDELHILPTDVRLTCPNFTEKTGPTRPTNPEEVVARSTRRRSPRSPPEQNLLKIYGNNKPEYSNTQQDLPDYWYILSRLLDMQSYMALELFC